MRRRRSDANKADAPNPAMTLLFQGGHHWRGIGDPDRSAVTLMGTQRCAGELAV
jgi:hypothetical protein